MVQDKKMVWTEALESIRVAISPAIYSTWFLQTHLVSLRSEKNRFMAEVGCASSFVKNTIETRYFGLIQETLEKIVGSPCDLTFVVKQNPETSRKTDLPTSPLFQPKMGLENETVQALIKSRIKPGSTFANFAVSSSNQMAHAAAEAVSKNLGQAYNPLFIWGEVGVGKTHLMFAVGNSVLINNHQQKVLFCTGEDFTNDIVEGIRNKTTQAFRDKYRKLSLLLIDDIQFIAGKDAVQEEFFHTFNAVTAAGGQIILTSDRPPHEIAKLEERLKSRFEAGLIVDIAPPDFELRCAITQIKAKEKGLELPMEIVQLLAANLDAARKIEGFLIRLTSAAKIKNSPITPEFTESLLGKNPQENHSSIKAKPADVIETVAKYYSLSKRSLLGDSRARPVALPRQILMNLLRMQLNLPLEEVGRLAGNRDHTTVMHGVDKITRLATTDVQIREDILGIKNQL